MSQENSVYNELGECFLKRLSTWGSSVDCVFDACTKLGIKCVVASSGSVESYIMAYSEIQDTLIIDPNALEQYVRSEGFEELIKIFRHELMHREFAHYRQRNCPELWLRPQSNVARALTFAIEDAYIMTTLKQRFNIDEMSKKYIDAAVLHCIGNDGSFSDTYQCFYYLYHSLIYLIYSMKHLLGVKSIDPTLNNLAKHGYYVLEKLFNNELNPCSMLSEIYEGVKNIRENPISVGTLPSPGNCAPGLIVDKDHLMRLRGVRDPGIIIKETIEVLTSALNKAELMGCIAVGEVISNYIINELDAIGVNRLGVTGSCPEDASPGLCMMLHHVFPNVFMLPNKCRFIRGDAELRNFIAFYARNKLGFTESSLVSGVSHIINTYLNEAREGGCQVNEELIMRISERIKDALIRAGIDVEKPIYGNLHGLNPDTRRILTIVFPGIIDAKNKPIEMATPQGTSKTLRHLSKLHPISNPITLRPTPRRFSARVFLAVVFGSVSVFYWCLAQVFGVLTILRYFYFPMHMYYYLGLSLFFALLYLASAVKRRIAGVWITVILLTLVSAVIFNHSPILSLITELTTLIITGSLIPKAINALRESKTNTIPGILLGLTIAIILIIYLGI